MSVKAMLGLLDKNFAVSGHAWFDGKDLLKESGEFLRKIRGSQIAVVLQNPMTCFDPLYRIGNQIGETFATHTDWKAEKIQERSMETLSRMRSEIRKKFFRNIRISCPAVCCRGS